MNENSWDCVDCKDCDHCKGCVNCDDCDYCRYCKDCTDCMDLYDCKGLVNKKYCIYDVQYTKDEYYDILDNVGY